MVGAEPIHSRLLAKSDYVSCYLQLTTDTYHLLDAAWFRQRKAGAHLINTSREVLTAQMALVQVFREGKLKGALDTFEPFDLHGEVEALPEHPLLAFENVRLTPHVAAFPVEANQNMFLARVENLVAALCGHWLRAVSISTINSGVVPRFPLADFDGLLLGH